MKYLHTMVRVTDLEASLAFYRDALGLEVIRQREYPQGRFTLVYLAAPGDSDAQLELTYNWDPEVYSGGRNFGHVAYEVDDINPAIKYTKSCRVGDTWMPEIRTDSLGV